MENKTSLRCKIGIGFIVLGIIFPIFGFIVPFLGFSASVSTAIIGFFIIGGPEVCLIVGVAIAGKEAVDLVKKRLFRPAGKTRYRIGLVLLCVSILSNWILAYAEVTQFISLPLDTQLYVMGGLDIVAIASLIILGPEFFDKLKKLFIWGGMKQKQL
jgi:hypothetical protein